MSTYKSKRHLKPSSFVKSSRHYRAWCSIVECPECGLVAKYEDMHPVNPCLSCGHKPIKEKVGRWISTRKWYQLKDRGYWLIKKEK